LGELLFRLKNTRKLLPTTQLIPDSTIQAITLSLTLTINPRTDTFFLELGAVLEPEGEGGIESFLLLKLFKISSAADHNSIANANGSDKILGKRWGTAQSKLQREH
jgi:hypothetical protein